MCIRFYDKPRKCMGQLSNIQQGYATLLDKEVKEHQVSKIKAPIISSLFSPIVFLWGMIPFHNHTTLQ